MHQPKLYIQMLGGFSIRLGDKEISDTDNRMRKVWLLLAYLIYRKGPAAPEEIEKLLWAEDDELSNPAGALKTMLYRVRTLLNKLGDDLGRELILRRDGGYVWNPDIDCEIDICRLDELAAQAGAARDAQAKLQLQRQMLALYTGDFLPKLSSEVWAMPIAAWYHRIWLDTLFQVLPRLEELEQWQESAELCTAALRIEPYSEEIYCHLMRARIALGDPTAAITAYETMSDLLFAQFGIMPSDEARSLYRLAGRAEEGSPVHITDARDLLRENEAPKGALYCEYDFFRILYQAQSRAIVRSGDTIHIALLTVTGKKGKELARRSLDTAADNLKGVLVGNLRQGDIVTRCSNTQFLIMLPQANYENSCMVCDRLVRAFFRQYPHSPADLHYSVQPMEPAGSAGNRE